MKCKIIVLFNFLGSFFPKCSFLRLQNFISPSIKYPVNLIFSVVVCICKINAFNGGNSISNHTKLLEQVTLTFYIFLKFPPVRYHLRYENPENISLLLQVFQNIWYFLKMANCRWVCPG